MNTLKTNFWLVHVYLNLTVWQVLLDVLSDGLRVLCVSDGQLIMLWKHMRCF